MFHGNRTINIYSKNKVFNIIAYVLEENHFRIHYFSNVIQIQNFISHFKITVLKGRSIVPSIRISL